MTVEDDTAMPDNYFSDITESDSYYRDILLALEFGVIDLEAGEEFKPTDTATREFAARTLNSCLQFQLDEGAEYTFNEAESVTYPDDIQVAINRNWFALSGGNFLPEQAITSAEATAMLNDAKSVLANDEIDENYNSTYEFADGTIVIPETASVTIDNDYTVAITDYETNIAVGDTFVVYNSGYPIAFNALSVDTADNITVISAEKNDSAIISADAEGAIDIDLENFDANEVSTYSITNTETSENEEMAIELYSINYDKGSKTLTASQKISVGSAAAGTVTVKLKNLKLNHKENVKAKTAEAVITADTTVTTEVSFDFGSYAGIPSSITLGVIPIAGVGSVSLEMEYSLTGGVSMSWDGKLKAGFSYNNGDLRLVKSYTKKGFSFTAEAQIKAGLRLSAAVDLVAVKGSIYGTVGVKMNFKLNSFDSGTPKSCVTIKGYLYAQVGATASVFGQNIPIKPQDIFTESNSPVRAVYHYEDGVLVNSCSRGLDLKYTTSTSSRYFNPSPSYGQGSYGGGEGVEPVVIWEYEVEDDGNATITKYSGNASAVAIPSTIDGYTLTKIGSNAFSGNTIICTVVIPETVILIGSSAFYGCTNLSNISFSEGLITIEDSAFSGCISLNNVELPYTVTTIGSSTFYGCTGLSDIILSDSILKISNRAFAGCTALKNFDFPEYLTSISNYAFLNCTALESVILPPHLKTCGCRAFMNCTSLSYAKIPKSLESCSFYEYEGLFPAYGGPFQGCSNLKTVEFEEGVTRIPQALFYFCNGITELNIPDTVTSIDMFGVASCSSLETVKGMESVTSIGMFAFQSNSTLKNFDLPKGLESVGAGAFSYCSALEKITVPKTLKSAGCDYSIVGLGVGTTYPFEGNTIKTIVFEEGCTTIPEKLCIKATSLSDVTIPETVTQTGSFMNCTSLKEISIPDSVTSMWSSTFYNCTSLENVKLPSTRKNIAASMFQNCISLTNIVLPDTVTAIGNSAFYGCSSLENINLPENLTTVGSSAFYECSNLKEINIPDNVTSIGSSSFYNCDTLTSVKASIKGSIGSKAFYDCDALTTLTLGDGVTEIGSNICYGCDSLTNVTLGSGITQIPDSAFRLCQSLTTVTLPRFCKTVGSNAFAEDTKLTSAYVPVSVTSIENNSFSYPAKMTMYGKSGSYAEEYANSRSMPFNAVSAPITSMSYSDGAIGIERYEKIIPKLNIEPAFDTSTVTFASSDETVCTVSEIGEIYGKKYGTATITATSDSGKIAVIDVTVVHPPEIASLNAAKNGNIYTVSLTAYSLPNDAVLWVAAYDKNDCLLGVKNVYLSNDTATVDFAADDVAVFRAFMWNTSTIEPITLCKKINV